MDDFSGILTEDFGFKPQGKSAPMASSRNSSSYGLGSGATAHSRSLSATKSSAPIFDDRDRDGLLFNDVFGGPPKYSGEPRGGSFDYDSIFKDQNMNNNNVKSSTMPVFDKPVYDDDIFDGLPGLKSASVNSSSVKQEDVFASISASPPKSRSHSSSAFDDLLGNLGRKETELKKQSVKVENDSSAFDDLLRGFGNSSSPNRSTSESARSQKPSTNSAKKSPNAMEDPFVILEKTATPPVTSAASPDPLEEISRIGNFGSRKMESSSASRGVFDDVDPLDGLGKSVPLVSTEIKNGVKDRSPLRTGSSGSTTYFTVNETIDKHPMDNTEGLSFQTQKKPVDNFQESPQTLFDMPTTSTAFRKSAGRSTSPPVYVNTSHDDPNFHVNIAGEPEEISDPLDDVWLTVSEIPLFTQPTSAPPPSRPPPQRSSRVSRPAGGSFSSSNSRKKVNDFSSSSNSPKSARAARSSATSQFDELEDFSMGRTSNNINEHGETLSGEDLDSNSVAAASAAAMKEAMDRAEVKFRHAREMREREYLKTAQNKENVQLDKDEKTVLDDQEREIREKQERQQREEEEREHRRHERERERAREIDREREEREKEQRRMERERIERERGRQAVERATREARERAAVEARLKAERAAVDKVNSEARGRAERAAVQRVQAEARERAAAEARERAERAAAEAREKAAVARAERAAVERAAAEARERASTASRANQQKNEDNDLESFFSMGSRPSSAPRPRANSSDPAFDTQNKGAPEASRRTSVGASSSMRKTSSTTDIVDDLTSIFGAPASTGQFQEFEGESEQRRRARLERHQRTQDRAAKALAEKNQRDLQAQRDQTERHRIAETLDAEIKRWAAGKEGNLRALLSTLQYVLWPECGWQPVSLTDLITGAAVKKVYRKATLCIHPDKVQQKGANLQQKYIAEKVFDLLKEAWNKFNSEELF
ncbi:hypothetical protein HS088_TW22G00191 [Tripterygium wilfordii]|uniref:Auxilin-related protein 2-like n=1 Tax=Tripterygium wilfordii TaxID=458696 RepID=A0A7J7BXB2_TRIWF|nr:auxilin-related protein 1-like [Tripterygium wilfordii]XP_038693126.1 auxilin-related protein 1-like [Tripterygium wilfordii]XP_038693127.1 auxilin-related protein 1-like [Tripterygium wilfordii]KAF5726513.1 hypothetical protein HS088_TW22G00191 [Tripterygium wilfordii]